jgi:serine/threonine-protein kinase
MSEQPRQDGAQPLKQIGGFELLSRIGQGGMGAVFKARQTSLDRIVALKVLPPSIAKDTKFIERFQREARACAKLNHPNIVQGVDVGQDEATGVWYFAMEYVDGPSVLKLLKSEGRIPEERALKIARDVASALECAASQGIVHRDIKPDNILLTADGEAKLADLGLARQMRDDASLTQSGQAIGTPYYMAPEQVRGRADQYDSRTDIYALGGTLFHLVTGQPPYSGETGAVIMSKHLTEPVPKAHKVNPDVSEECSRLIERMMQKKPEQRVQTPAELLAQIERVMRGEITAGPKLPVRGHATARRPKEAVEQPASRAPVALGVGAVAVVAVLAFVLLRGSGTPPDAKAEKSESAVAAVSPPAKPATPTTPAPVPAKKPAPKAAAETKPAAVPVTKPAAPEPAPAAPKTPAKPETKPEAPTAPAPGPAETPATKAAPPTPVAPEPKAVPAAAPRAEWPLAEILATVRENAPKKAVERVRDGNYPAKDTMLEALSLLDTQREARYAAITNLIGQSVKLDTVKGPQNGKLVAFKNGTLQLERAIVINGESRGSTQANVAMDDLTPAALERIAPLPAPTTPAGWIAAALTAMAASQLESADAALGHLAGNDLQGVLAAEVKRTRTREHETQARAAWAKIEARAAEAPSQARAKQLLEELAAFAKKFADAEFAATPEMAAKIQELKEKFDRLSLGLDPRVLRLFRGRVLNYDARTQVITLGYDFSNKEQLEDFVDSTWAPPGDHTGLTWRKGELRTFCKGTADRVLRMPQFASGSLSIQFDHKKHEGTRERFEVEVSFYGMDSTGKTPKMSFRASEKGCFLLQNGAAVKSDDDEILLKKEGTVELSCQGQAVVAKVHGKVTLEHSLSKPNDHAGFWIGGGWDSGITFTRMQVSGRLDSAWLAKALEAAPKIRK